MRISTPILALAGALAVPLFVVACQAMPQRASDIEAGISAPRTAVVEVREDGLIANYYPAARAGAPGPALLMLGGSEGGLSEGVAEEAKALQAEGISVLQLSFYRAEGQPENLELIPLETFDRGLEWLTTRGEVDPRRIGIFGTSKGAEAALITATRHPELQAVVANVPSSVSWTGINWDFDGRIPEASWTLDGAPYPALPYGAFDYESGVYSLYANGLKDVDAHPDTVIEIEKAGGPVLLVCGGSDALWPSCPMTEALEARAAAMDGPEVTLLAYPDAGHGAGGMPAEEIDPATADEPLDWGGTSRTNHAAHRDSWPKVVAFLKETL